MHTVYTGLQNLAKYRNCFFPRSHLQGVELPRARADDLVHLMNASTLSAYGGKVRGNFRWGGGYERKKGARGGEGSEGGEVWERGGYGKGDCTGRGGDTRAGGVEGITFTWRGTNHRQALALQ